MAEHLIFEAGEQTLGVAVDCVQEVVRAVTLSPPVGQEGAIEGLLNLRGHVVSVIDLGQCLNLEMPALAESDYLVVLTDRSGRLCAVRACGLVKLTSEADLVVDSAAGSRLGPTAGNSETQFDNQAALPLTAGYLKVDRLVVPLLNPEALSGSAHSVIQNSGASATTAAESAEGNG